jgi:NifB/MoaA-like Fe-S oxidoreductase
MVRQLLDEWTEAKADLPALRPRSATLVCGTLIAPVMNRIVEELSQFTGVDLRLVPVVNRFFGPVTTVSGLLTGADVVAALQDQPLGDVVLLPQAMFASGIGPGSALPGMTLDDMPIAAISTQLGSQSGVQVEIASTMSEALAVLK